MANGKVCIGFSKPYVAKYTNTGGTVSYSGGMPLARGVSVSIEPTVSDNNNFYADNVLAETEAGVFTGGTATLTVDGLLQEAEQFIMGLPEPEEVSYGTSKTVEVLKYGNSASIPNVGIGFLIMYMSDGVISYAPMVLRKAKFNTPGTSAETKGETINWQTQELTATLMRDDSPAAEWKWIGADQTSEAEADEIVKAFLNITGT